jgi:hypothetical protein
MEVLLNKLFDKHSEGYGVYDRENLIKDICKELKNLQLLQTGVMQRYFHPFVGAGTLVKETEKSLVIKLDFNGKEYFAPKYEFTELL